MTIAEQGGGELALRLVLALVVILGACRAVAWVAVRLGQSTVTSEMIAGVLLGPSLFGWLAPRAQAWVFPKETMPALYAAAQLGVALYMFVVGLELDLSLVRARARSAVAVSLAGIAAPLALGAAIAWRAYDTPGLFGARATRPEAALFLGAAMSITAFPMLARIIHERGLAGTALGALALAAGAIDDVLAWGILALAMAGFAGDATWAVLAIGGGTAYVIVALTLGRRTLGRLEARAARAGRATPATLGAAIALVLVAAWVTDALRVHAVFGAFVLGVAMPRGVLSRALDRALTPLTSALLLPVFFTYSGLNTRLDLIAGTGAWALAGVVLVAAIAGKGVACAWAARARGETWRDAIAIGTLMNARGLMELIILNIGLERGVIGPTLFTVMALMAVVTTLMATPVFARLAPRPAAEPA